MEVPSKVENDFFIIKRNIYSLPASTISEHDHTKTKEPRSRFSTCCKNRICTLRNLKSRILRFFPFLLIFKNYQIRSDLLGDIVAGLTVGIMHIPQGLAYGILANLLPIFGLYVSFFAGLVYFFFGTSRHLSFGTFAVISVMIAGIVDKSGCNEEHHVQSTALNGNFTSFTTSATTMFTTDLENATMMTSNHSLSSYTDFVDETTLCKLGFATAATMLIGLYLIAMGLLGLGFLTTYMPEPLTRGFTTGAAFHVFASQMKHVFGVAINMTSGNFKLIKIYYNLFRKIQTTNFAALLTFLSCGTILYLWKRFLNDRIKKKVKVPFPMELTIIVLATVCSHFGNFSGIFAMKVVGPIPTGLPAPRLPHVDRLAEVAVDAVGVAFVVFAIGISMAQIYASKHNYHIDPNQELIAYGMTNFVTSFFCCYASSAALARTSVLEGTGGRTQISSIIACALLLGVLFGVGPLFKELPTSVLAAIIIVNLEGLFRQLKDLPFLWKRNKYDFLIWLVVFLGVVLLDVDKGLLIGIAFALYTLILRDQRSKINVLGNVPSSEIYKTATYGSQTSDNPEIRVFRFESAIHFANAEPLSKKLFEMSGVGDMVVHKKKSAEAKHATTDEKASKDVEQVESAPLEKLSVLRAVILDCSCVSYIDTSGVNVLQRIVKKCQSVDVEVLLASCSDSLLSALAKCEFFKVYNHADVFYTIHDAVLFASRKMATSLNDSDIQNQVQVSTIPSGDRC